MSAEKKMKWSRLKDLKCPKCSTTKILERVEDIVAGVTLQDYYKCRYEKCTFKVSKARFDEIVSSLYRR